MGPFDVAVLGGGMDGCCAAIAAIEAGATVLLAEKARAGQGSTWQSAGTFAFAGTDLQKDIGDACLRQPGGIAFQLFDRKVMDQSVPVPSNNDFAGADRRGLLRKGDTLGQAAAAGLPVAAVEAAVACYNTLAAAGHDSDHGRASLGGG